jgi:hypothetical protein
MRRRIVGACAAALLTGAAGAGAPAASAAQSGPIHTLALAPLPLSNGVGDLARELAYMRATSAFSRVAIVNGTRPFQSNLLTAIVG